MNNLQLIGTVTGNVAYFCTNEGRDLTRFQLTTDATLHHCEAWGPAALDLHASLRVGETVCIEGPLRHRVRRSGAERPTVTVRGYTYL